MHRLLQNSYFSKKGTYYYMKRVKEIIHYRCKGTMDYRWLGQGIVVAVLDTGISLHPELAGRILQFKDFVNDRPDMYDDNPYTAVITTATATT